MFYSYFDYLCKQKGVSVNKACQEMGVSRSVAAKWKATDTSPRMDTLIKISNYFGVSIDTLLEHSGENKKPAIEHDDGYQRKREKVMSLFDDLTEGEIDMIIAQLEGLIRYRSNQDSHQ